MKHRWIVRLILLLLDLGLLEAAFYGAYWWKFRTGMFQNAVRFSPPELLLPSLIVSLYWVVLLAWFGLYRFDPLQSRLETVRRSFRAAGIGVLLLFILTFDPSRPLASSRHILLLYGSEIFIIVGGDRVLLLTFLREMRIRGIGALRTVIVGTGEQAASILRYLRSHPGLGLRIQGMVGSPSINRELTSIPVLGTHSQLRRILTGGKCDAVILAPDESEERQLGRVVAVLRRFRLRAFISAEQYNLLIGEVKPSYVHGHPLVDVRPELLSTTERILKRAIDLLFSTALLGLSFPIWVLLLLLIPLDSTGPIFYTQKRVGMNGRPFTLYKFRSMIKGAEAEVGAVWAARNDPRITRLGHLMRPLRLDELPQLINIFLGQMSLVGPRPERIEFVRKFVHDIPLYERRMKVKPGLTGWSQVHLKYDSRMDEIPLKLKYDFFYIEHMSLPLDLKILFMTLFVILRGEGQ